MQRKKILLLATAVMAVFTVFADVQGTKPFTVPEVQEWKCGKGVFMSEGGMDDYRIIFKIKKDKTLGDEGYAINITNKGITATAPTERGLLWAQRTLTQLFEQSADGSLPCGTIKDSPRYPMRGFMLDCARKFIPLKNLYDLVDLMSYYKMNTLQLHLNDCGMMHYFNSDWDATPAFFRLECDTYPGLASPDGYYTKKEFKALQKYAASQGVEIIPEIDTPAHSLAFTHYRPDLGSKEYGMDHLDLQHPDLYPFLDALFKEYLEGDDPVFCGSRVNIGTDEYSNRDSVIVEEFRRFTDHYIRYVESYGKQAALWGSLTHADGVTPVKADGVLMNCWYNGYADPHKMKEAGYQLLCIPDEMVYIVPAVGYYQDYLDCKFLYENWTPAHIGTEVFEEGDPSIQGGMFALWNDHAGNGIGVIDIMDRVYPAVQTISAKTWSADRVSLDYAAFDSLRQDVGHAIFRQAVGIGWPYTVSFEIDGADEVPGTALASDGYTTLWLADPLRGLLGYSRDGYLYTFNYRVERGHHTVAIKCTDMYTQLIVDGRVRDTLQRRWRYYSNKGEIQQAEIVTFMYPFNATERPHKSKVSRPVITKE